MRRLLSLALWATSSSSLAQVDGVTLPSGDPIDAPAPLIEGTTDPVLTPLQAPPPGLPDSDEARAPRDFVRLVYTPGSFADSCPVVDDVKSRVLGHLGYDPFGEPAQKVVVLLLDGAVGEDPARARLELLDTQLRPLGSRVIEANDGCEELVATAALQISIALDPLAASPTAAPPPPTPPTPAPAVTTRPRAFVVEDDIDDIDDVRLIVSADAHVAMLLAPGDPMIGVGLGVGGRWNALSVRGELRGDFTSDDDNGTSAFPVLFSAVACAHLPIFDLGGDDGVIEAAGCLTGTTGVIPLAGEFSGVGFYVGGGGRAGLDWRFDDDTVLRLFSQIEGAVLRPSFTSSSGGSFTSSPVNLIIGFGVDIGDW